MSKNRLALMILTASGVVVSFGLLKFAYQKSLCSLLEDLLLSIMTGCLIAIPSGILLFVDEYKKLKIKKNKLIANISDTIASIEISDLANCHPALNEIRRRQLVKYYHELVQDYTENIWTDEDNVNQLTMAMFQLSLSIKQLDDLVSSGHLITTEQFDSLKNQIIRNQQLCKRYIRKLNSSLGNV